MIVFSCGYELYFAAVGLRGVWWVLSAGSLVFFDDGISFLCPCLGVFIFERGGLRVCDFLFFLAGGFT